MDLKDLRKIKSLDDLERADLPPVEITGEWWREYGQLTEPRTASELMDFAAKALRAAVYELKMTEKDGVLTPEAERDTWRTLAIVREVKRRSDHQYVVEQRLPQPDPGSGPGYEPHRFTQIADTPHVPEGKSYRALFATPHQSLPDGGFKTFPEFLRVLSSGRWDPRLDALEQKAHIAGDLSLGGFAVPEAWSSFLFDGIVQASAILPRARVVPMNALQLHIPAWDDLNQSTGTTFGGFTGAWLAEGATAVEETAKLREIKLTAHKLAIFTSLSRELVLGTEGRMQTELRTALTRAVAATLDKAFLTGTDVGQPEGVLNAPALKGVARNAAGDVKYVDLAAVYAAVHPAFAARATWYINPTVLPKLLNMIDASSRLIWVASGADAAPTTIFGRPVVYSDRLPTLGSKGDVLIVADDSYAVGMLQNITIDVTTAAQWTKDLISLRCVVLADGQLSWDKVYTAPDAATYSTAVALNA